MVVFGFSFVGVVGVKFFGEIVMESDVNLNVKLWVYNLCVGEIYVFDGLGMNFIGMVYGEVGDVIGVGVDLVQREMWVMKNGVKVGVYDDEDGDVLGRLFFIVGFGGFVQFEVNFGGFGREFVWKGEQQQQEEEEEGS